MSLAVRRWYDYELGCFSNIRLVLTGACLDRQGILLDKFLPNNLYSLLNILWSSKRAQWFSPDLKVVQLVKQLNKYRI